MNRGAVGMPDRASPGGQTVSDVAGSSAVPLIGVYVHWPYCAQKCPYCDFNSHVRFDGWDETRLLKAYVRELRHVAQLAGRRRVQSVFFGGGTPSLMRGDTAARIIEAIGDVWDLERDAEITLEANPGSVDVGRFQDYRAAGVNRVSLGVQSFDDDELKALGRIHSARDAKDAIALSQKVFERSSFDLIYARPGQELASWRVELGEALSMASGGHLSLYQLTIEPDTPFAKLHGAGKLVVPAAEQALELYKVTQELTEKAGLPAYEISNHADPGQESAHNLIYWRYREYAGIGPGAHGRLNLGSARHASATERHPETWVSRVEANGHGFCELSALSAAEQADEMLLMGLRLAEGLDVDALARVAGFRLTDHVVRRLCDEGTLDVLEGGRRIRANGAGRFILNELVVRLSMGLVPSGISEERKRPTTSDIGDGK